LVSVYDESGLPEKFSCDLVGYRRSVDNSSLLRRSALLAAVRRLAFGVILIAMASSALLLSDLNQRKQNRGHVPRVAVLQHASQALLDESVQGMIEGLKDNGFRQGETVAITQYNAQNDLPTDNAIAKEITDGRFDLVLTSSTLSMQAVANANRGGAAIHVFGAVADPFVAGVGLVRENPMAHPKHFVGIETFMPVVDCFTLARQMFPGLKTVGVVWNPGEANSRAYTEKARETAGKLGIELLEANADSSSGVSEAALSVVTRGAQAIWVGGDVTVMVAIDSLVNAAKRGHIPVFTITPPSAQRGALFDLGANFTTVGRQVGALAAKILQGADPASIPITNVVPQKLVINKTALAGLKDPWTLPDDVIAKANIIIDETGPHERTAGVSGPR
jgi:ABC-type uncharacterized transport system substrate-binding protein